MKFLKHLMVFLFVAFVFGTCLVKADTTTCNDSKIAIGNVVVENKSENVVEVNSAVFEGTTIKINVKMKEVGDNIKYKLTVRNTDSEDYKLNAIKLTSDGGYIEYNFAPGADVIKPNESKDISLTLKYAKEIPDTMLSEGSLKLNNNINLSVSADNQVTPGIVVDDKIEGNPKTGVFSQTLLLFTVLLFFGLLYVILHKEAKKSKILGIILLLLIVPLTVHAACELKLKLELSVEIEKEQTPEPTTPEPDTPPVVDTSKSLLKKAINTEDDCIVKYSGQVTDRFNTTKTATNVYIDKCSDKRNVIVNGFCFQIIRTTEDNGVKMIYNGKAEGNKCLEDRANTFGIVSSWSNKLNIGGNSYLYADSYTYDTTTKKFTLVNGTSAIWGDTTYKNLVDKYTCKTASPTCGTLYHINDYENANYAWASSFKIDTVHKSSIGATVFNSNANSPTSVGYGFNNTENNNIRSYTLSGTNYLYGTNVSYSNDTGKYTMGGTNAQLTNDRHYTCLTTEATCEEIAFIYYKNNTTAYYIPLRGGNLLNDVILNGGNQNIQNVLDSNVKGIVDAWFMNEFATASGILDDAVYCNDRKITDLGGWKNTGSLTSPMMFNPLSDNDLSCSRINDQFANNNTVAFLHYKVGLPTAPELNLLTSTLRKSGSTYWTMTPTMYGDYESGYGTYQASQLYYLKGDGSIAVAGNNIFNGVRPAITIKGETEVVSGNGSEESPFVIGTTQ